jgi:hypothetical protein
MIDANQLSKLTPEDRAMIATIIDAHYEIYGSAVKGDLHGSLYAAGKQAGRVEARQYKLAGRAPSSPAPSAADTQQMLAVSRQGQSIARSVDQIVMKAAGERVAWFFCILTYPRGSYFSNAKREDTGREMRRLLEAWDAGLPDIPNHEIG